MNSDPVRPSAAMPVSPYAPTQPLPSAVQPTATAPPPRGCFTCRNLVLGCGLGCLGLVLAGVIGGFVLYNWLKTPSVPVAPEVFLDADTVAMAAIQVDPKDAGVADLLKALAGEIDARRPDAIPHDARRVFDFFGYKDTPAILGSVLPVNFMKVHRRPEGKPEEQRRLTAVSVSRFSHLVGMVFQGQPVPPGGAEDTYRGCRILSEAPREASGEDDDGGKERPGRRPGIVRKRLPGRAGVKAQPGQVQMARAMVANTHVEADDPAEVKRAIDAIQSGNTNPTADVLMLELRERLDKSPFAWGVVLNRDGALLEYLPFLGELDERVRHHESIEGVSGDMKILSADTTRGAAHFRMRNREAANVFADFLNERAPAIHDSIKSEHEIDVQFSAKAENSWVEVSIDVAGVKQALLKAVLHEK